MKAAFHRKTLVFVALCAAFAFFLIMGFSSAQSDSGDIYGIPLWAIGAVTIIAMIIFIGAAIFREKEDLVLEI